MQTNNCRGKAARRLSQSSVRTVRDDDGRSPLDVPHDDIILRESCRRRNVSPKKENQNPPDVPAPRCIAQHTRRAQTAESKYSAYCEEHFRHEDPDLKVADPIIMKALHLPRATLSLAFWSGPMQAKDSSAPIKTLPGRPARCFRVTWEHGASFPALLTKLLQFTILIVSVNPSWIFLELDFHFIFTLITKPSRISEL